MIKHWQIYKRLKASSHDSLLSNFTWWSSQSWLINGLTFVSLHNSRLCRLVTGKNLCHFTIRLLKEHGHVLHCTTILGRKSCEKEARLKLFRCAAIRGKMKTNQKRSQVQLLFAAVASTLCVSNVWPHHKRMLSSSPVFSHFFHF